VVSVAGPRRISGAIACAQFLLARVRDEHDRTFEHVHELVFQRVPMPQRRLAARPERDEIHAEPLSPQASPSRRLARSPIRERKGSAIFASI